MNCDRLARWYRVLEYLGMGRALERRRWEFLAEMTGEKSPGRALLLGDGDGRFLAALLSTAPAMQGDSVDNSVEMLSLSRRRAVNLLGEETVNRRVRFYHADALNWQPPAGQRYDWIVTHFFQDCLTEPEIDALISRLSPFIAPGARWVVAEFHQPASGFAAWRARLWIGGLYRLFRWATGLQVRRLPDYRSRLEKHGFRLEKKILANQSLLVSELWRRQGDGFCVDASTDAHLHSRTPKS